MLLRSIGLTAAVIASHATAAAAQENLTPLLSPAELAEVREGMDPLILDIRAAKSEGEAPSYAVGHVEGSISAPYSLFRGPAENPGQLPSEQALTETLRGLGVTPERPTVIVYQGADVSDFGAAARVYWTLKSSGVSELAILNGGIAAWIEAGQSLSTESTAAEPSTIQVSFSEEWLATAEDVQAVLSGEDEATLIDARPESFWAGEEMHGAAARPGTLPQSEYFVHSSWFGDGPAIVDAAAAQQLAEEAGYADDAQLISFCNTGHWAATNWFALSELAGLDNVKLYPESMVGWSNAGYEMANVPGPLRTIWLQIKNVF
ncbi:sulfurtransferase [Roseitranquillus sediminis]|uniref:sulfurtransferase n=1 Tax=Roseitranquillus sediminis TaxID=2809051 RepID=UPI001D0C1C47|nr:rhodanese-like domain-containing protein [Roseitranquillus sediminis]MBM9594058.1 sulfurtransferase [Roseitranquillus sediminis]